MLLDMFRTPLYPSSEASYCCTCSLWSPCGVGSVVSSSLVLLLLQLSRVSVDIGSFLLLHMQSLVTVWCWVGCFLQPCSVVTAAKAAVTTEQGYRKQPTQHHTVTRDCMCSNKKLLMMDTMVSETCRAA
jgi:hypothetical protein